jgi:hypothetical protein
MSVDLFETIDALDGDDDYYLNLVRASWGGSDLELAVDLHLHNGSVEKWMVTCQSVREHVVRLGYCDHDPDVTSDHVVLWPHITPTVSLYFHGTASDPAAVVGTLHNTHTDFVGRWVRFERWFNSHMPLPKLIAAGHGLLAEGPEQLIKAYERVMQSFGFQTSTLSRPPVYWEGRHWVESTGPLVAFVSEPTYAIATTIRSERVV